jgi:hypothetical protein
MKYNEIISLYLPFYFCHILFIQYTMVFDSPNANKLHKVFHGLYSDMQRAYAECRLKQLEPTVQSVDSWRKLPLPADMREQLLSTSTSSINSTYFPEEIQQHILNERSVVITYRFTVLSTDSSNSKRPGRNMVLHFVVFNKPNPDLKKMLAYAKHVCALMHLVSMHASRATCSATLNIFIYMTKFKKLFPTANGHTLHAEHANTGLSYHCAKNNDLVVYRKEEWFKVLIHESFHAFGLSFIETDMPAGVDDTMQRMLQRTYAISHPVLVYETYCEIWARILNVFFSCFSPNDESVFVGGAPILNVKLNAFIECAMDGLHRDAQHALRQCAKLMHYMGIPYDVLCNPTKENRAIVAKKYREDTNIFAYYVMTCALQHSPETFLVWCYENNPTSAVKPRANILQFRTIPSNFNGFMELIHYCKHCTPLSLHQTMDKDDVLGSTMRMTSTDFMKN